MTHEPPKQRLLSATLTNAIVQVWQYASAFGSGIITARWLGLDEKGAYRLITMVPTIVFMFSELGLGAATVYVLGKKRFDIASTFGHLIWACPAAGALGFGGYYLLLPTLERTVLSGVPHECLIAVGLSVPLTLLAFLIGHLLLATDQYRHYNLGLSVAATIKLIALFFLIVVSSGGLLAATFAWIIGEACHVAYVLWRAARVVRPSFRIDFSWLKAFLRYGIQVQIVGLFLLANLQSDTLLLSHFSGEDKSLVGLYAVSMSVSTLLLFIPMAASVILTPKLSASSQEDAAKLTCLSLRCTLWVGILCGLGLAVVSWWIVPFAFGEPFRQSLPALWILIPGAVLYGESRILGSYLNMQGKPFINAMGGAAALLVNVSLTIWLVPSLWGVGSAFGSLFSYVAYFTVLTLSFRALTGCGLREILIPSKEDWDDFCARIQSLRGRQPSTRSQKGEKV
ncbi:MAG: polysaccharide biosynthesis C-terminal domain-containing protein [Planctomycetota bacterium]